MHYKNLFTSESVTEGHPDKVCDQISDGVLDAVLAGDRNARVACETMVTTGMVMVAGELSCDCYVDIPKVARNIIREIGYDSSDLGFDYNTCAVLTAIDEQSSDIAMGVDSAMEYRGEAYDLIGAGDQGMVFGYACRETKELMPSPLVMSHNLTRRLAEVRKQLILPFIRPDGKAQVTVEYNELGLPGRIDAVVVSTQHSPDVDIEVLREAVMEEVVKKVLPAELLDAQTRFYINPTGRFVIGGPQGDSGLTGRKIIVDTYGGCARHGGGAFSGKDPTKVDRSGAYMARYAARNLVSAGLCDKCEIQVSYAIGVAKPVSIAVNTFGTGKMADERLAALAGECFDFRPAAIIDQLDLRRPQYRHLASYGHFGRYDLMPAWERDDKIEVIKSKLLLDK